MIFTFFKIDLSELVKRHFRSSIEDPTSFFVDTRDDFPHSEIIYATEESGSK